MSFSLFLQTGCVTPQAPTHRRRVSDPVAVNKACMWGPARFTPVQQVQVNSPQAFAVSSNVSFQSNVSFSTGSFSSTPMTPMQTPRRTPLCSPTSSMSTTVGTAHTASPMKCVRKRSKTLSFDLTPTDLDHILGIPEMRLVDAGLDIQKELGHGNQSSVHLALETTTDSFICIKRFNKASMSKSSFDFMKDEYKVMLEVGSHPHLTQAYRMFQDDSFFHIELDLYEGGDLSELKQKALGAGLNCDEQWWTRVFQQAMEGLAHLHSHDYIHCDVKEANMMLKSTNYHEPEVVLIDFGVVQEINSKRTAVFGTPGYIAPEVWDEKTWTPKGDAFSLGVVILQMLTDRVPNSDHPRCGYFTEDTKNYKDIKIATQTRTPDVSSLLEGYGTRLQKLTESLLEKDPAQRPSVSEARCLLESFEVADIYIESIKCQEKSNIEHEKVAEVQP